MRERDSVVIAQKKFDPRNDFSAILSSSTNTKETYPPKTRQRFSCETDPFIVDWQMPKMKLYDIEETDLHTPAIVTHF
jgi:hypothetical protein